ncbi:hypothetical protein F4779DRAFT_601318 [Xylariaceae sp. FL0662B]|nr:hypothetical protein F4779DRAFT_601318 [Xylariaceae sp. FL0662B]
MRGWLLARSSSVAGLCRWRFRCLSTISSGIHDVQRVSIRVGSSGNVNIDLHNLAKVSSSDPLMIYLPPYSTALADDDVLLPKFIKRLPTAVINYRWTGFSPDGAGDLSASVPDGEEGEDEHGHLSWPTPIHDTLCAYTWIVGNLMPSTYTRRDLYVYGSYLGASLATSLALTESRPHERFGVRGCIAYNGIYNWTMFLPDHPINKAPKLHSMNILEAILSQPEDTDCRELKQHVEGLFAKPEDLFDPFASACLFFHTPGLFVPPSFDASAIPHGSSLLTDSFETEAESELLTPLKPPRKSPLAFPPRKSTLKVPEMLLLHTTPPPLPPSLLRRRQRRKKGHVGINFSTQAEELAACMRRSINKLEIKERLKWDDDYEGWDGEAARRIQVRDVGHNPGDFGLHGEGDGLAATWLEEHLARRS